MAELGWQTLTEAANDYFFNGLPPKELARLAMRCSAAWEADQERIRVLEQTATSVVRAIGEPERNVTIAMLERVLVHDSAPAPEEGASPD